MPFTVTMRRGARAARALIVLGDIIDVMWNSFEVIENVIDDTEVQWQKSEVKPE